MDNSYSGTLNVHDTENLFPTDSSKFVNNDYNSTAKSQSSDAVIAASTDNPPHQNSQSPSVRSMYGHSTRNPAERIRSVTSARLTTHQVPRPSQSVEATTLPANAVRTKKRKQPPTTTDTASKRLSGQPRDHDNDKALVPTTPTPPRLEWDEKESDDSKSHTDASVTRPSAAQSPSAPTPTTTTTSASLNVYDSVLAESKDLLQAAQQAQQLGRLKMASAYLLLLHARLVGLGKRFDRVPAAMDMMKTVMKTSIAAKRQEKEKKAARESAGASSTQQPERSCGKSKTALQPPEAPPEPARNPDHDESDQTAPLVSKTPQEQPILASTRDPQSSRQGQNSSKTQLENETSPDTDNRVGVAPSASHHSPSKSGVVNAPGDLDQLSVPLSPNTQAVQELANRLRPSGIEMDKEMIEHLVKAATKLHATRKRKNGRAAKKNIPSSVCSSQGVGVNSVADPGTVSNGRTSSKHFPGIAWTEEEIDKLTTAINQGIQNPKRLARLLPSRTVHQVSIYLRNHLQRQQAHNSIDFTSSANDPAAALAATAPTKSHDVAVGGTNKSIAIDSGVTTGVPNSVTPFPTIIQGGDHGTNANQDGNGKKPGRKPVTSAINTMPHALCDVKALLSGAGPAMPLADTEQVDNESTNV